jgi:hypothetical protein
MRKLCGVLLLAALTGCMEPSKRAQLGQLVFDLNVLHSWDPGRKAQGQYPYDAIMSCPPDIDHALAAAVTDERPTAIYDVDSQRTALVGDVSFLMLLDRLGLKWESFYKQGVFMSTALPNPVFCLKWDPGARARVRAKLLEILPPLEEE